MRSLLLGHLLQKSQSLLASEGYGIDGEDGILGETVLGKNVEQSDERTLSENQVKIFR